MDQTPRHLKNPGLRRDLGSRVRASIMALLPRANGPLQPRPAPAQGVDRETFASGVGVYRSKWLGMGLKGRSETRRVSRGRASCRGTGRIRSRRGRRVAGPCRGSWRGRRRPRTRSAAVAPCECPRLPLITGHCTAPPHGMQEPCCVLPRVMPAPPSALDGDRRGVPRSGHPANQPLSTGPQPRRGRSKVAQGDRREPWGRRGERYTGAPEAGRFRRLVGPLAAPDG